MSVRTPPSAGRSRGAQRLTIALRAALYAALGVSAVLPLACGSSSKSLIPTADAGPLRSDFEEVAQDAQNAEGDCDTTTAALNKTAQDFAALPASVDQGLHAKLKVGIENLRERALALCAQPPTRTATTSTARTSSTTRTSKPVIPSPTLTSTQTTPTTPTPTATTPTPPAENGGGTAAPSGEAGPGGGAEAGVGESGGASAGGSEPAK